MLSEPAIIVPTTPLYFWELPVFLKCLNVFWPGAVPTIVCSEKPTFEGEWSYSKSESLEGNYSGGLKNWLNDQSFELFVLLHSDFWLNMPVRLIALREVARFMLATRSVVRISLDDQAHLDMKESERAAVELVCELENVGVYGCGRGSDCFFSFALIPAIWRRELVVQILESGWDPWTTERAGKSRLVDFPDFCSYLSWPPILSNKHLARTRDKMVDLRLEEESHFMVEWVKPWIPPDFQVIL